MARLRGISLQILVGLLAAAAALLLAELTLRGYQAVKARSAQPLRFIEPDARLGWRATANYEVRYRTRDAGGAEQTIRYSSLAGGFRLFGDASAPRPKLLIIGDSFTQAVNVPTDETYAGLLAQTLEVEVFSYGSGGFGTLQELMVLDEVIDAIQPDLVVLQFSANDFVNNAFALESKSSINNNRLVRPYLAASGAIAYRNPFFDSAFLSGLLQWSRLFKSLAARLYAPGGDSVELAVARDPGLPEFQEAVALTRALLQRFKQRVGSGRQLAVFMADGASTRSTTLPAQYQAYAARAEASLAELLKELQISFIPGVPDAIARRQVQGAIVTDADGAHWNALGHSLVAEHLRKWVHLLQLARSKPVDA